MNRDIEYLREFRNNISQNAPINDSINAIFTAICMSLILIDSSLLRDARKLVIRMHNKNNKNQLSAYWGYATVIANNRANTTITKSISLISLLIFITYSNFHPSIFEAY